MMGTVEELEEYLQKKAKPGDDFWILSYWDLCEEENTIAQDKYPDENGRVPPGGPC